MSVAESGVATKEQLLASKRALYFIWGAGFFISIIQIVYYSEFNVFGKILMYDMQMGWCLLQVVLFYLAPIMSALVFVFGSRYGVQKGIDRSFLVAVILSSFVSSIGFPSVTALPFIKEMASDRDIIHYYNLSSLIFGAINTCFTIPLCAIVFTVEGGRRPEG